MRKNTNRSTMRKKPQKLWNMIGCSKKCTRRHKHNASCKKRIAYKKMQMGGKQMGGCSTCLQTGGSANSALIGSPWTGSVSDWPGVAGKDGQTNYFPLNTYPVDPQTQNIISERSDIRMSGGKTKNHMRGGQGMIPQDLVNLGRSMVYGIGSAYNSLNGFPAPVNPLPYKDQLVNTSKGLI